MNKTSHLQSSLTLLKVLVTLAITGLTQHKGRSSIAGFTLLTVLWIILLLSVFAASISLISVSTRKQTADYVNSKTLDTAMDAAFEGIVFDLLTNDSKSRWAPAQGPVRGLFQWNGVDLVIEVSADAGKVDVNKASDEILETFFVGAGLDGVTASRLIFGLREAQRSLPEPKRFGVVDELLRIPGMSRPLLDCLRSHITLYTWRTKPDISIADDAIKRVFSEGPNNPLESSAHSRAMSAIGQALTLKITVTNRSDFIPDRYIRIRLTGNNQKPLWIYSWYQQRSRLKSHYPACQL
ncbi:MAG: hypothetical protein AAGJ09_00715 [Pseudomonadota bacterium]